MAIKVNVAYDFLHKAISAKLLIGQKVYDGLTENIDLFPQLPFLTKDLNGTTDTMQSASIAAAKGGKLAAIALEEAEEDWDNKFELTANYVNYIANGDETIIIKSGFSSTKSTKTPKSPVGMLNITEVIPTKVKGTCKITAQPNKDADGYVCVASPENVSLTMNGDTLAINVNGTVVYVQPSSRKTVLMQGLPSSKPLSVTMFGYNSKGSGPIAPSQEVTPQ